MGTGARACFEDACSSRIFLCRPGVFQRKRAMAYGALGGCSRPNSRLKRSPQWCCASSGRVVASSRKWGAGGWLVKTPSR